MHFAHQDCHARCEYSLSSHQDDQILDIYTLSRTEEKVAVLVRKVKWALRRVLDDAGRGDVNLNDNVLRANVFDAIDDILHCVEQQTCPSCARPVAMNNF